MTSISSRSVELAPFSDFFLENVEDDKPVIPNVTAGRDSASSTNRQRMVWHFLTLGIPLFIESLSVFCDSLVKREKVGLSMRVRFKSQHLSPDKAGLLSRYHKYDVISNKALNAAEYNKALQLIHRSINIIEDGRTKEENEAIKACRERLMKLVNLLEKCKKPKATRADFSTQDWQTRDLINFELAKDYFEVLANIFNADWFKNSGIRARMLSDYNIDYNEATLAESLAQTLPYIEGLDGQTISLPVLDKNSGECYLSPYLIKSTLLGDALPCYLLESADVNAPNWFLIRGTQYYTKVSEKGAEYRVGSLESMLTDAIDPKCIARHVINKSLIYRHVVKEGDGYFQKESLGDIFLRLRSQGKKTILSGHSLGATLANALVVEFPQDIEKAYGFSGAGVSQEISDKWELLCAKDPSLASRLINFDYEGDVVPSGGRCLIGTHLALTALFQVERHGLYTSHVRSRLNRDFQLQKIDVSRENSKFTRSFSERLRIIVGLCLRFILNLFNVKYLPDWWKQRRVYREYADLFRRLHITPFAT